MEVRDAAKRALEKSEVREVNTETVLLIMDFALKNKQFVIQWK